MSVTERKCKHCGCTMPCKTARKVFCTGKSCRTNHHNHKALIMTVQTITQTITQTFNKQGAQQWQHLQVPIPS